MTPLRIALFAVLFSVVGLLAGNAPARAAWPHHPLTSVEIYSGRNYRNSPVACPDGVGGAFVVWLDFQRTPSCHCDIRTDAVLRHVSRDGEPLNSEVLSLGEEVERPRIVADGRGGALVAWHGWNEDGSHGIFVQRVDETGTHLWTEGGVCVTPDSAWIGSDPVIAADGVGGALVAWLENRTEFDSRFQRVYIQRIAASGSAMWIAGGRMPAEAAWEMRSPSIAAAPDGGAIVAWEDLRTGSSDIYAQKLDPSWGYFAWPEDYDHGPDYQGMVVSAADSNQTNPQIVSDGLGGACIVWEDSRNGNRDLYAQRLVGGYPAWPSDGRAVSTAPGSQQDPAVTSDGASGVAIAWRDFRAGAEADLFAQRLSGAGQALFASNGIALCTVAGDQAGLCVASDGSGGLIASWVDSRLGSSDFWGQRVSADGVVRWATGGAPISLAAGGQYRAAITSDGRGGAIVVWDGASDDYSVDIYAQRIDRSGDLGDPAPSIAAVRDVPNDQGGRVRLTWYSSYLDVDPTYPIASYWVWRSIPEQMALAALQRRAALHASGEETSSFDPGLIERTIELGSTVFWELIGTQSASGDSGYSMVIATTSDSMPDANPPTMFRVQARHRDEYSFWTSGTASGYSKDNLPPPMPTGLVANVADGALRLHWHRSPAPDFATFRLYEGGSPEFVPGPGNLVSTQSDTGYAVPPTYSVFKLSAVDTHGNESARVTLAAAPIVGIDDTHRFSLDLSAAPNPVRDRARIGFVLPVASDVRLAVFDVAGRVVRELGKGNYAAGTHVVEWAGDDEAGRRLSSGLYYVRMEAGSLRLTRRVAVSR